MKRNRPKVKRAPKATPRIEQRRKIWVQHTAPAHLVLRIGSCGGDRIKGRRVKKWHGAVARAAKREVKRLKGDVAMLMKRARTQLLMQEHPWSAAGAVAAIAAPFATMMALWRLAPWACVHKASGAYAVML